MKEKVDKLFKMEEERKKAQQIAKYNKTRRQQIKKMQRVEMQRVHVGVSGQVSGQSYSVRLVLF